MFRKDGPDAVEIGPAGLRGLAFVRGRKPARRGDPRRRGIASLGRDQAE